ncbi:DUF4136 domain-containing protein [Flavihumibacter sp. R14]|nr:DUF4136 domain-containing protein [Flavihumibacter soli]
MKNFKPIIIVLLVISICACGTSTSITRSYKKPGTTAKTYKKIFLSVIASDVATKQTIESQLASALQTNGIEVVKSIDAFPPSEKVADKETLLGKIRSYNPEAIVTVALVDKETEQRYVPGNFYNYYSGWYGSVYSPGYYTNDKVYYLETNLYDATAEDLIWSAQSETYNPSNLESFVEGYRKAIRKKLQEDGIIPPPQK